MARNGRVRPSGRKAGIFRISLLIWFFILPILIVLERGAQGASVKGAKSAAGDGIFERPLHGFDPENAEEEPAPQDREKRLIPPNPRTKVVSMFFNKHPDVDPNRTRETIDDLTTTDIIIRLQEKYEGGICQNYLESVPDLRNKYFTFDASLVTNLNLQTDPGPKFKHRYRVLQELCNKDNEKAFWREMFQKAENDHYRELKEKQPTSTSNKNKDKNITTTPIPDWKYDHLQIPMATMMERWNAVWYKYQDKSVCNQRLLLECIDPPSDTYRELFMKGRTDPELGVCECRGREVGLPSVFPTGNIYNVEGRGKNTGAFKIFVTSYYVNKRKVVNGEEVIVRGEYDYLNRCVVQANMAGDIFNRPMLITNPCDFSLPMIGMCTADCVFNASCVSATPEEKADMRERAGKDTVKRIRDRKAHAVFHKKCQCDKDDKGKPKVCHQAGTDNFNKDSGSERSTIRPGSLALATFSICVLYTFLF